MITILNKEPQHVKEKKEKEKEKEKRSCGADIYSKNIVGLYD